MLVKKLLVSEPLHLVLGENPLGGAVGVRAGDVVGSLHHLKRDVLLHALFAKRAATLVELDHSRSGAVVAANLAKHIVLGVNS